MNRAQGQRGSKLSWNNPLCQPTKRVRCTSYLLCNVVKVDPQLWKERERGGWKLNKNFKRQIKSNGNGFYLEAGLYSAGLKTNCGGVEWLIELIFRRVAPRKVSNLHKLLIDWVSRWVLSVELFRSWGVNLRISLLSRV